MNPYESVAARMMTLIASEIEHLGLSQAEFCRRVGVSTKHLNQCLSGQAHAAIPMMEYWAFALGKTFEVHWKEAD
jgi:transcriptional regulator with XRE-family HTH domain